jgi:acyl dehydratase
MLAATAAGIESRSNRRNGACPVPDICGLLCSPGTFCRQSTLCDAPSGKGTELHRIRSIEDAKALEGKEVGISEWITVDQQKINQFADATGDYQWIHVDEERAARELPEGKTIAHGYLTLALVPNLTGNFVQVDNLVRAINFGCNKIRFYSPVPVGAKVRARAVVLQARKRSGALHLTSQITIEVEGVRKPACVAETIGIYFVEEGSL